MKIACLGWGSLIWNHGELKVPKSKWRKGGPLLPIEFTRISTNECVTLVIDGVAKKEVRVLWAELKKIDKLEDAICLLAKREGTICNNIHYYCKVNGKFHDEVNEKIKGKITEWLERKKLDAVVWTGLRPKNRNGGGHLLVAGVIKHLKGLDPCDKKRAEEYIRKAPKQIDTEYRKEIEAEFGWTPE